MRLQFPVGNSAAEGIVFSITSTGNAITPHTVIPSLNLYWWADRIQPLAVLEMTLVVGVPLRRFTVKIFVIAVPAPFGCITDHIMQSIVVWRKTSNWKMKRFSFNLVVPKSLVLTRKLVDR